MKKRNHTWLRGLAGVCLLSAALLAGCGSKETEPAETAVTAEETSETAEEIKETQAETSEAAESVQAEGGETELSGPELLAVLPESMSEINENYLDGGELRLLASAEGWQSESCVLRTKGGEVIVVDGGRPVDDEHLVEVLQEMGGHVSAWLITHPHDDHVGALTDILNTEPMPVEIDKIYYHFLPYEVYEQGEHQNRMGNLDNLLAAFEHTDPEMLVSDIEAGDQIQLSDAVITVLNHPYTYSRAVFNNSSVVYRIDTAGKRLLFLGDLGWEAGEDLLRDCRPEDLKADVVQMSHHGQSGVEFDVYEAVSPEICLWPTPRWLWDNELNGVPGEGEFKTLEVRSWMKSLGVTKNLTVADGDAVLR